MVAATFAADTPLAVTGMVAVGGIAGNWLWPFLREITPFRDRAFQQR
jgi:hypothetical protein